MMMMFSVVSVFLMLLLLKFHDLSMGEEISLLKKVVRREESMLLSCPDLSCPTGYTCDVLTKKCKRLSDELWDH
uniref:Kappa-scoloptoxin SsmTx-I n=1 Tax=Scolopendra mutilans TaxID=2836329 RepID=TX44A_SCOMU